jgi:hypothetical protein
MILLTSSLLPPYFLLTSSLSPLMTLPAPGAPSFSMVWRPCHPDPAGRHFTLRGSFAHLPYSIRGRFDDRFMRISGFIRPGMRPPLRTFIPPTRIGHFPRVPQASVNARHWRCGGRTFVSLGNRMGTRQCSGMPGGWSNRLLRVFTSTGVLPDEEHRPV